MMPGHPFLRACCQLSDHWGGCCALRPQPSCRLAPPSARCALPCCASSALLAAPPQPLFLCTTQKTQTLHVCTACVALHPASNMHVFFACRARYVHLHLIMLLCLCRCLRPPRMYAAQGLPVTHLHYHEGIRKHWKGTYRVTMHAVAEAMAVVITPGVPIIKATTSKQHSTCRVQILTLTEY